MKRPNREYIERDRDRLLEDARPDDLERSRSVAAGLSKAEAEYEIRRGIQGPIETLFARINLVIALFQGLRLIRAYRELLAILKDIEKMLDELEKDERQ